MLNKIKSKVIGLYLSIEAVKRIAIDGEFRDLRAQAKYAGSRNLVRFGNKVFSQGDEDGIVAEIFHRIGTTNKRFVEFGAGDGLENNTAALLMQGWSGLWIEGSEGHTAAMKAGLPNLISQQRLVVRQAFIDRENIDGLITEGGVSGEIDLLSLDLDGNDYAIYEGISSIAPRVVIFEYNAKFAPPIEYCMPYKADHHWRGGDAFGMSLSFLVRRMTDRGYSLVGCCLCGTNAFFVRTDLIGDHFEGPFDAEKHWEPARYHLTHLPSGHRPSFASIDA